MDDMEHQVFSPPGQHAKIYWSNYKKYAAAIRRQQIGLLPMYGSS